LGFWVRVGLWVSRWLRGFLGLAGLGGFWELLVRGLGRGREGLGGIGGELGDLEDSVGDLEGRRKLNQNFVLENLRKYVDLLASFQKLLFRVRCDRGCADLLDPKKSQP
jgi:hypothetical protein